MELDQCYVAFLRKGPIWTADEAPELDALQEKHLEHLNRMAESGKMAVAGPIESLAKTDLRGISIFYSQAFASLDELKTLVEQDPMIQIGRLVPEYYTWYFPKGRISFGPTL
jgi:uncharacterized protein YciI